MSTQAGRAIFVVALLLFLPACTGKESRKLMTVELDVFSGRPNPHWTLTEQETTRVEELLSDLPSEPGVSTESGLGFRGFILSDGERRITVGGGSVRFEREAADSVRRDAKGLERYLRELANARGYGALI